jgi:hypothetical protein
MEYVMSFEIAFFVLSHQRQPPHGVEEMEAAYRRKLVLRFFAR